MGKNSGLLHDWRSRGVVRARNRAERRALARRSRGRRAGAVASVALVLGTMVSPTVASAATASEPEFRVTRHDLEFILRQIKISEAHAAGGDLLCASPTDTSGTCLPDANLPWGLRTVDGSFNNLRPGQSHFGASGQVFPRLTAPSFRPGDVLSFDPDGPMGPAVAGVDTTYAQTNGFVEDAQPRIISNLIVDQTVTNPAAVQAAEAVPGSHPFDHDADPATPDRLFIPNEAPDEALSAPFSSWFTLFGQFFDHGLDLVSKGGNGTVAVPLQPDDPLYDHTPGARTNFIMVTRATNLPGPDGQLGTTDDIREHTNRTTPFIDQNQTYTSHPSHQFFIREYEATPNGPVPTGHLLDGADGGLATWADIKHQARTVLGISLDDLDVLNVPLVATDPYGRFVPGPNGMPQLVIAGDPNTLLEGNLEAPVDATEAMEANHAFLDDIAHAAAPLNSRGQRLTPDADSEAGPSDAVLTGGAYDDELLESHFITGDGRGNENIGLTAVHHVFHSEHNRLVGHIEQVLAATGDQAFLDQWHDESGPWDYGERLFQAARFVTEMQYQHLALEEFARKVQPNIDAQPTNETAYHSDINPAITAEFAHVVYRFGHSMLTDTVARDGFGTDDLGLLEAFLNPAEFTDNGRITPDQGAAAVIQGMARQTGNAIDEFVDDTLRNELLGLPLDLAAINIVRGRDTGMPTLQQARRTFYDATHDAALKPYDSWEDFRLSMKHRSSIVNFVAAYGKHQTLTDAATVAAKREAAELLVADEGFMTSPANESGLDDVDFWIGGLAEDGMIFGGLLGPTFNFVFEEHMENLQNADRFYYLTRTQGLNLIHQLENSSFAELVMRNTDASLLPSDIFSNPNHVFDLANLSDPLPEGLRLLNGTYRYDGDAHIVMHGTEGDDRMRGGAGDDSLWGHGGVDRIEGGMGNDTSHGGPGNDILTDLFGDDTFHGGDGDDAINAGAGLDLIFGGFGQDFILHGSDPTQDFAGAGNDLVRGGTGNDIVTGNEGDDWLEGGNGHDLVQGDNALTFQNDPFGGADVLWGGSGNDDHDAEGGDDIMLNNGIDRHAGMLGFDWVTHQHDPFAGNSDLDSGVFQPDHVTMLNSRYMGIEGLSGWTGNDVLRGAGDRGDVAFADGSGSELTQAHLDRIAGLRDLLGGGTDPVHAAPFMTTNEANNILLGGGGSDVIEGRAGNDFIDGSAQLEVRLVGPGGERANSMLAFQSRVFDGTISPADINILREVVVVDEPTVVNTAVFSDDADNYEVTFNTDGTFTVAHVDGTQLDGVDTLRNIQRLTFADTSIEVEDLRNTAATGTITFSTDNPVEGEPLTATAVLQDLDGVDNATIEFTWQVETADGQWVVASGSDGSDTFVPSQAEVGARLRVVVSFQDGKGVLETITSDPTGVVANVDQPAEQPALSTLAPELGVALTASLPVDPDGVVESTVTFQWEAGDGTTFQPIAGAQEATFTPTAAQRGLQLRVVVSFTDTQGNQERVVSTSTAAVAGVIAPSAPGIGAATAGDASATVTWSEPADDGGSEISGYEVVVHRGETVLRTVSGIAASATSTVIDGLTNGTTYTFTVRATNATGTSPESARSAAVTPVAPAAPPAPVQPVPSRSGYWMVQGDGVVHAFGDAAHKGNAPVGASTAQDLEPTPSGNGYWVVSSSGSVFAFGDAPYLGGAGPLDAGEQVTSISATATGRGYWLFTSKGRVINHGDAGHFGGMERVALNGPVLDSIPTPSGKGYYMVASDGGVFAFGDAVFIDSMGGKPLNAPVQSLVPDGDGRGYWLVASDGGIFAFDAPFFGSMGATPLNKPVTGMVGFGSAGYLMVAEDGGTFAFGSARFHGSLAGKALTKPITSIAALTK